MTKEQKEAFEKLIEVNEQFKGMRIIIDYAISLVTEFTNMDMNKEMTAYAEKLYEEKYGL